jgi:hypothetical protein
MVYGSVEEDIRNEIFDKSQMKKDYPQIPPNAQISH